MAAVAGRRADDAILETMTQQLLQISSVFLVQQSELQQVRDRLKKELVRVNTISEALTSAAQQHQDAVLTVIQNYESVAAESAGDALGPVAATSAAAVAAGTAASVSEGGHRAPPPPPPPMQMSAPGAPPPHLDQALARQQSVRQVHLPPVASQPSVFTQLPAPPDEDEDEGIRYVDNLKVVGGLLGTPLKASGEFVGTPEATWFRQRSSLTGRGEDRFVPLGAAQGLEYLPTADDVGAVLRLECVGPYGGKPVAVETSPIALDPPTHAELETFLRKGQAEFHAFTPQQEARIVLVTRKNIKVRSKSSRMGGGASTLYKQGYQRPVTAVVDEHSPQEMALQLGALKFELLMETPRLRDLAVLCIRMFAGPNCPTHEQLGAELDLAESEDMSARSQPDGSERPTEAPSSARGAAPPAGAGGAELGGVHWSDEEEEGEGEEEFKPAMEVKIRAIEDVVVADTTTLKKFSLGLAPPKAAGGSRSRAGTGATPPSPARRAGEAAVAGAAAAAPLAAGSAEALPSVSAADAASEPAVAASSSFPAVDFDGAFGSGAPAAEASAAGGATAFFDNAFAGSWAAGGLATAASRGSAGSLDSSDALPAPEAAPAQLFDAAFGGGAVSPPVAPAEPSVFDAFGVASAAPGPAPAASVFDAFGAAAADAPPGGTPFEPPAPAPLFDAAFGGGGPADMNASDAPATGEVAEAAAPELPVAAEAQAGGIVADGGGGSAVAGGAAGREEGAKEGGSGEEVGGHSLLISEVVNARLEGRKLLQYRVSGELRLVSPAARPGTSEFRFRLRNAHRIEQVKVNDKFVKANDGMYTVSLPPTRDPKPLPLMKYVASGRWRPVPVYVDAEAAEAAGGVRVRAAVETNPQLKTPLQDVAVALRVQDEGASCSEVEPAGGWDEAGSSVKWRIDELAREKPASCSALVAGGGALAREACSRGAMQVQFGCEGVTITGIELEVQVGTTGSPVSRLLRRFTSGKYEVAPAEPRL